MRSPTRSKARRIARAEAHLASTAPTIADRSPWDWYADACPCDRPAGECVEHPRARASQRPPDGDWRTWLLLMGRGAGKTRSAAEWVRHQVETGKHRWIALVGPTAADVRDYMVGGHSGILAISPPWFRPRYEPSKRRLTWPNGAMATTFSAEEPDHLRGPQHSAAWVDELAAWRYPQALENLLLGLRVGTDTRLCVTTTPRPTSLVTDLIADPTTAIARGTTYENRATWHRRSSSGSPPSSRGPAWASRSCTAKSSRSSDGVWFDRFDPARHISATAEYHPRFRVHLAIDCGVSRHVAAVWLQSEEIGEHKHKVTVFGEWHGEGLYSEAAARAIRSHGEALPCQGRLDSVRLDPAATARTGIGPTAYGEFERVFGARNLAHWPRHRVADGLDQLEVLLDKGLLLIHPRCTKLKAAFQNYRRKRTGRGDWLDEPEDPQHPHEDLMDALRGGVRDRFPDGRIESDAGIRRIATGWIV